MENENQEEQKEEVQEEQPKLEMVDKALEAAKRLEEANRVMSENLAKQEKIQAFQALGGKSEVTSEQPKEETAQEYAQKALRNEL